MGRGHVVSDAGKPRGEFRVLFWGMGGVYEVVVNDWSTFSNVHSWESRARIASSKWCCEEKKTPTPSEKERENIKFEVATGRGPRFKPSAYTIGTARRYLCSLERFLPHRFPLPLPTRTPPVARWYR